MIFFDHLPFLFHVALENITVSPGLKKMDHFDSGPFPEAGFGQLLLALCVDGVSPLVKSSLSYINVASPLIAIRKLKWDVNIWFKW